MKQTPIIFSGEMIRAILDGRKSMTRRIVKPHPKSNDAMMKWPHGQSQCRWSDVVKEINLAVKAGWCPYGAPGSQLWVKETFQVCRNCRTLNFKATVNRPNNCSGCDEYLGRWTSPLFMPKWASRITLEITAIKVERVQEISPEGCEAEGITLDSELWPNINRSDKLQEHYRRLWQSIHGPDSWKANPWVWCLTFRRIK